MKKSINALFIVLILFSIFSCTSEQKKFRMAKEKNSMEALKDFGANYPNSVYIDSVKDIIDDLLWDSILARYVICDFENFIEDHPNTKYIDSAKLMINKLMPVDEYDEEVNDVDCNLYKVVTIGKQNWMAENLRTTRFKDRTPVELIPDEKNWLTDSAAFSWYENQVFDFKYPYGALYNWQAVNSGKLCPKGWHVPTQEEWNVLINHLGGMQNAGIKMKMTGDEFWVAGNEKSNNASEFSALPAGMRDENGVFSGMGESAMWWTASESEEGGQAMAAGLNAKSGNVVLGSHKRTNGFAVRCVEDVEEEE